MQLAALLISIVALAVSLLGVRRQIALARHANSLGVLINLFTEHRGDRLAQARRFVATELGDYDLSLGMAGLPQDKALLVRDLAWYYDNLGVLVVHDVVDIELVAGYLGGSVMAAWDKLEPIVKVERAKRRAAGGVADPGRWQEYFEIIATLFRDEPQLMARTYRRRRWWQKL